MASYRAVTAAIILASLAIGSEQQARRPRLTKVSEALVTPGSDAGAAHRLSLRRIGEVPNDQNAFTSVQFINSLEGWISTAGQVVSPLRGPATIEGKLWRTSDGGKRWEIVHDDPRRQIDEFQFVNSRTGWMLASRTMYKTVNGGKTWHLFRQPIPPMFEGDLCTFHFLKDGRQGWVAGGIYMPIHDKSFPPTRYSSLDGRKELRGVIFHTIDGGRTWRRSLLARDWGYIGQLTLPDSSHGCAVGISGVFFLKNGTWRSTTTNWVENGKYLVHSLVTEIGGPTIEPVAIHMLNPTLVWLTNNNGYVGASTNGGKTWKDIANLHSIPQGRVWPPLYLEKIYFADSRRGAALDSYGAIRQTVDGGRHWIERDPAVQFNDFSFFDGRHGRAVSKTGLYALSF